MTGRRDAAPSVSSYRSGHSGIGRCSSFRGVYGGVSCTCGCHSVTLPAVHDALPTSTPGADGPGGWVDDRVVLPLGHVRDAAAALCGWWCGRRRPDGHVDPCLVPLLERRDALLDEGAELGRVSGDCAYPVKHGACSGCACSCHRHSARVVAS